MKLATNVHHASGHCLKGFQGFRGQSSEVRVQRSEFRGQRSEFRGQGVYRCMNAVMAEAFISTACRRGSLVAVQFKCLYCCNHCVP